MKILLFISSLLIATCTWGQMRLQDINDTKIRQRIELIKSKTDSFLLTHFKKSIRLKFELDFPSCGYFRGELHSIYQFLNSDKPDAKDLYHLTHFYNFLDKNISLKTDIGIWIYQDEEIKMEFETTADSLKYEALNKIYNKGFIIKIREKMDKLKLKKPYTVIQVDEKRLTFDIILKDQSLPHNFFVR